MEEVDAIIIDSLKHLNCTIEDEITSLKQFDNDLMIKSIMACLDSISPGTGFPNILPISMSQRLKLATNIAEHIKELGFRGDIGYQTILYCNEVEARRLLMFLIERLPREPDKSPHAEDTGRGSNIVKEIKRKLNVGLKAVWLPSEILKYGIRQTDNSILQMGYGHCFPLKTVDLLVPNSKNELSEEMTQYYAHHLPDVTKQCSSEALIPSLLFRDLVHINKTSLNHLTVAVDNKHDETWEEIQNSIKNTTSEDNDVIKITKENDKNNISAKTPEFENVIDKLSEEIKQEKENIATIQKELKFLETKKNKILEDKNVKQQELDNLKQKLNIKTKSHTVLSNNDNLAKLKVVIDTGNQKLLDLTNQWHQVQEPLLKQYRLLQENSHMNESEVYNLQEILQKLKLKSQKAQEELREKTQLQAQLSEQISKITKQTNRSAYTRRIMEIISNINKQSTDIDKILADTKAVQKEINTLNGQLERSFALSDEVIFRDAKHEETSRKAYKLLACMHSEYEQVIQIVSELGSIIRETRNLQEQVDTEESRDIHARLERVMADLDQVRKETTMLLNK